MKHFIIVLCVVFVFFETKSQTVIPAVNNVGGGTFRNASYEVDFSIGETSIKTINTPTIQISEGVIQRTEATCTTPSLVISGSNSVCASVSGFYFVRNPTKTSSYTWSTTGLSNIVTGQGTSRIFVSFGANVADQISVVETTKNSCVGQPTTIQIQQNAGRYGIPPVDLNCSTTLFFVPILTTSTVPNGITAMDVTLAYDQSLVTPTGISFLGNVVRQAFANNAISLYTDFSELGVVRTSISYSGLAPITANFAGSGTIIGFSFNRLPAFNPGTTTSINITELIEGNLAGINYQCGSAGIITLKNNEIFGQVSNYFNSRPLAYNVSNPAQFNLTQITATDAYCQPYTYSVVPDLTGSFRYNLDKGEKISITRDVPGSYYSATALNVQSVINSNDAIAISSALIRPAFTNESWKQINNSPLKLAKVYAMDVDLDGLVTSQDLYYVQKRSVLQIKEFPQVWNYTDGFPNNTNDLSKDWIFVNNDRFNLVAAPLNQIAILPSLSDCLDEPTPDPTSCASTGINSFRGILLGDVDGNWNQAPLNSNAIRSSAENQFIVDLDSTVAINGGYLVPLYLQYADSVKAIDFNFEYDSTRLIVAEVKPTFDPIAKNFIWNDFNKNTVLAGAYSADTFGTNRPIYFLKLLSSVPVSRSTFKEFKSYINGAEVPVVFRQTAITGNASNENLASYLNVFPNPTTGMVSVIGKNWGGDTIISEIYNSSGKLVSSLAIPNTQSDIYAELDLNHLDLGLYFIKLHSQHSSKVIKLIKQ